MLKLIYIQLFLFLSVLALPTIEVFSDKANNFVLLDNMADEEVEKNFNIFEIQIINHNKLNINTFSFYRNSINNFQERICSNLFLNNFYIPPEYI